MINKLFPRRPFLPAGVAVMAALILSACSGDESTPDVAAGSVGSSSSSGAGGDATSGSTTGSGGAGGGAGETYKAYNLFTHVPRFAIYKADPARNICVRLIVSAFSGPGTYEIQTTPGSGIDSVEITDNVSDCDPPKGFPAPAVGASVQAMSATGTLDIHGTFPCDIDVHATLLFAPGAPWIPSSEPMDVDMLSVDGGCG